MMFACVARSFSQVVLGLPLGLVPCRRPIIRSSVMPSFFTTVGDHGKPVVS